MLISLALSVNQSFVEDVYLSEVSLRLHVDLLSISVCLSIFVLFVCFGHTVL